MKMADRPGRLLIHRPERGYRDRSRRFVVYVDGQRTGTIGPGERLDLIVLAGAHRVQARIDFLRSRSAHVDVSDGQEFNVTIRAGGRPKVEVQAP
jgi:hypothetical protein